MPSNVEIKAKISNFSSFLQKAICISDKPEVVMRQVDTYFKIPAGRLKLRRIQDENAELIYYNRPDTDGPKLSNYSKQAFKDSEEAEGLKNVLASSLGILGVINKQRHLLMCGQTRIHVDHVEHLGHFMELEVMLNEEQTLEEGQLIANDLMEKLDVANDDLISGSYIDMLVNKK
ncbi:hypothetical protein X975_02024, partial [Stegodyphus mimosarum]